MIKIDLVLGILFKVLSGQKLYVNHENLSWTVEGATWTEKAPRIIKCHLVMSGDFFHVSFCLFEAEKISQHITDSNVQGQVKGACIRSIKVRSDKVQLPSCVIPLRGWSAKLKKYCYFLNLKTLFDFNINN